MATVLPRQVTPIELIPAVETDVFSEHPTAVFWVGKLATGQEIERPAEMHAAHLLRARVYVDEMGFLPPESIVNGHGEVDDDDKRSIQFGIVERTQENNEARMVGTSRLILKSSPDQQLPIERLFPEAFEGGPAPIGSAEASRFIARHPDRMTQHLIAMANIRTLDLYSVKEDIPYVYAVIEEPLAKLFRVIGLPHERISDFRSVEEYGDTLNMAIRINPHEVVSSLNTDMTGRVILKKFFQNSIANSGMGFYGKELQ